MSNSNQLKEALFQAERDTQKEIENTPNEATGCCTISSGGYSEQKSGITKASCDKQKAPGYTVTWKKGSC